MSGAPAAWPPYRVRTHNAATHSENRIHSDEVARSFGFKGALVPGVTVFAHMTQPLVERYGETWLARGLAEVRFAKPAYDGELLTIQTRDADDASGHELTCVNADGIEIARMSASVQKAPSAPDPRAEVAPAPPIDARPEISWELVEIGRPFPALAWHPTQADNLAWCDEVHDELPIYRTGHAALLQPGLVLRQANMALRNRFTLPAWIHTASQIVFRHALRAGHPYEVRAIPEEKWIRKGHEFVRLYVAIVSASHVMAEVLHTAILRPRSGGVDRSA